MTFVAVAAAMAIGLQAGDLTDRRFGVIAVLAFAMGLRNAVVKALAVRDLTTTVVTLTLTSLAADSPLGGGAGSGAPRKLAGVTTMLLGAVSGALLVLHEGVTSALVVVSVLLVVAVAVFGRSTAQAGHGPERTNV